MSWPDETFLILFFLLLRMTKKQGLLDVKTVTMSSKGQIAIPREMRQIDGFKDGERITILSFEIREDRRSFGCSDKRHPAMSTHPPSATFLNF